MCGFSEARSSENPENVSGSVRSHAKTRRGVCTSSCSAAIRSLRRAITQISSSFSCSSSCFTNSAPRPLEAPVTIAILLSILSALSFKNPLEADRAKLSFSLRRRNQQAIQYTESNSRNRPNDPGSFPTP